VAWKSLGENQQDHTQCNASSKEKNVPSLQATTVGQWRHREKYYNDEEKGKHYTKLLITSSVAVEHFYKHFCYDLLQVHEHSSSWENCTGVWFIPNTRTARNEHKPFQEWLLVKDSGKSSRQHAAVGEQS